MPDISFMSANFVARELDWQMPDWAAGDQSVNDAFRPIETYRERFGAMLDAVVAMGFSAIDLWEAHLSPQWATDAHVATANELLQARSLRVASLAGWFGTERAELEAASRLAVAVGAPILGGRSRLLDTDRGAVVDLMERHDLVFALENHPERTPAEVLARIGEESERIGATVDTGWFATQGHDPARAIELLGSRVLHVHLKDVRHAGEPHTTTAYGEGIVPLRECVEALQRQEYRGTISVEHESEDHDPTDELRAAREQLEAWLAASPR